MTSIRADLERSARHGRSVEKLTAAGADLTGASLSRLRADLVVFDRADLTGALMPGAHLADCDLVDATLVDTTLSGATMWQCKAHGATADRLMLTNATLVICWMRSARLVEASFVRATLEHCDLSGSDLRRANFSHVRTVELDLRDADLRDADLTRADLTGADLRGARLDGAIFADAILTGARFDGEPPDTSTVAYSWDGLVATLSRRDPDAARRWWRDRPSDLDGGTYPDLTGRMSTRDIAARFGPAPVLALYDEVLAGDDQITLFEALRDVWLLAQDGWDLAELVPRLPALLDRPRRPVIPGSGGRARVTADPGRWAAMLLGRLAYGEPGPVADAALAGLRGGLSGSAHSQRAAAFGLAGEGALNDDWAEVDRLLDAERAGIRAAACEGLKDLASGVTHRPPKGVAAVHRVQERTTRMLTDPIKTVRTAADGVQKELYRWQRSHDIAVGHGYVTCPDCG